MIDDRFTIDEHPDRGAVATLLEEVLRSDGRTPVPSRRRRVVRTKTPCPRSRRSIGPAGPVSFGVLIRHRLNVDGARLPVGALEMVATRRDVRNRGALCRRSREARGDREEARGRDDGRRRHPALLPPVRLRLGTLVTDAAAARSGRRAVGTPDSANEGAPGAARRRRRDPPGLESAVGAVRGPAVRAALLPGVGPNPPLPEGGILGRPRGVRQREFDRLRRIRDRGWSALRAGILRADDAYDPRGVRGAGADRKEIRPERYLSGSGRGPKESRRRRLTAGAEPLDPMFGDRLQVRLLDPLGTLDRLGSVFERRLARGAFAGLSRVDPAVRRRTRISARISRRSLHGIGVGRLDRRERLLRSRPGWTRPYRTGFGPGRDSAGNRSGISVSKTIGAALSIHCFRGLRRTCSISIRSNRDVWGRKPFLDVKRPCFATIPARSGPISGPCSPGPMKEYKDMRSGFPVLLMVLILAAFGATVASAMIEVDITSIDPSDGQLDDNVVDTLTVYWEIDVDDGESGDYRVRDRRRRHAGERRAGQRRGRRGFLQRQQVGVDRGFRSPRTWTTADGDYTVYVIATGRGPPRTRRPIRSRSTWTTCPTRRRVCRWAPATPSSSWTGTSHDDRDITNYFVYYATPPRRDGRRLRRHRHRPGATRPLDAQDADELIVTGLDNNTTYYFRLQVIDENDNESELSEEKSGHPGQSSAAWRICRARTGVAGWLDGMAPT